MTTINEIKEKAKLLRACKAIDSVDDWASLCSLFFSPAGREFCELNSFPDRNTYLSIKKAVETYGIVVDGGDMIITSNAPNIAVVGNTNASIYVKGAEEIHRIIAIYGAKAKIIASKYAVVDIVKYEGGDVEFINTDGTAILLK